MTKNHYYCMCVYVRLISIGSRIQVRVQWAWHKIMPLPLNQHGALHRAFLLCSLAVVGKKSPSRRKLIHQRYVNIVCHFFRQKLVRPWPYQLYLCRWPCSLFLFHIFFRWFPPHPHHCFMKARPELAAPRTSSANSVSLFFIFFSHHSWVAPLLSSTNSLIKAHPEKVAPQSLASYWLLSPLSSITKNSCNH